MTFGVFWLLFNLHGENTTSSTLNPTDSDKFRVSHIRFKKCNISLIFNSYARYYTGM